MPVASVVLRARPRPMRHRKVATAIAIVVAALGVSCDALLGVPDPVLRSADGGPAPPFVDASSSLDATTGVDATIGTSDGGGSSDDAGPTTLTLDHPALDLGPVTYAQASTAAKCTLTNTGASPATSLAFQIGGPNASDFAQSNDCGTSLAAGASCHLAIVFTPTDVGPRHATLSVTSDAGGASVTMGGTGAYAYGELTDLTLWEQADLTPLFAHLDAGVPLFGGSAFDGRHIYLFPNGQYQSIAVQYDTTHPFGLDGGAFAAFDTMNIKGMPDTGSSPAYFGAVFDGRYVYGVPNDQGHGVVRYDTQALFGDRTSWERYDPSMSNAALGTFCGGAFDGRYVYFAPLAGTGPSGVALRYDTQAVSFTDPAGWVPFDVTLKNPLAKGFNGALYDGKYVYFVPDFNGTTNDGIVARFDPSGGFQNVGSWLTFDTTQVSPNARGFEGAVYDGTYVYLVPNYAGAQDGVIARYEAGGGFADASSWTSFDLAARNPAFVGYSGGVFDGRYLYLAPNTNEFQQPSGLVTRMDTQAPFDAGASWNAFDTTQLNDAAASYSNAAFDGRYVYLVPNSALFLRFHAKEPAGMPAGYHGSFF